MMIDVDRFKFYNDCYGHQQGDQCLRDVATAVAGSARRPGDMAARYGGEEFVTLLPGASAADAARIAEDLRAAIEAIGREHAANPPDRVVTASIGVATMAPVPDAAGHRPEDLVAAADAALYRAKNAGRNQVVSRDTGQRYR
jgi:diguanylate cyclase (GGDEF)-like protein